MNIHHASVEEHMNARVEATGHVIANFAWQHLKAAATFRDHVAEIESQSFDQPFGLFFEDIRSYGSACIMSGAASLEALVNEFFITPEGPLRRQLRDFEAEFWGRGGIEWKPPLEKYQLALEMLGQPRLDEHAPTFRNAWALIELRNALVHYKPTWDPDRQRKVELVEVLTGKYDLSPFPDSGSDFVTMRSMSASCMRWVIISVLNFLREFHALSRIDEHKLSSFWKLDTGPKGLGLTYFAGELTGHRSSNSDYSSEQVARLLPTADSSCSCHSQDYRRP